MIQDYVEQIKEMIPGVRIEVRLDAAFFQRPILDWLDGHGVEFAVKVPMHSWTGLKDAINSALANNLVRNFQIYSGIAQTRERTPSRTGIFSFTPSKPCASSGSRSPDGLSTRAAPRSSSFAKTSGGKKVYQDIADQLAAA